MPASSSDRTTLDTALGPSVSPTPSVPSGLGRRSPNAPSSACGLVGRGAVDADEQGRAADLGLQFGRSSLAHDHTVVDDRDALGELIGLLQVLRGQQHGRSVVVESSDLLPQRDPTHRVESGGRLVEEQDRRLVDQRQREVETAPHPARVGADSAIAGRGEADPFEQFVGLGVVLRLRQAVEHRLEVQELAAGHQRIDRRVLQRDADVAAHVVGLRRRRRIRRPVRCRRSGAAAW